MGNDNINPNKTKAQETGPGNGPADSPLSDSFPGLSLSPDSKMENGWIKLWRKTLDSRIFQDEPLLKLWVWCLLRAGHTEKWVTVNTGRGTSQVHLLPGQFIFGRNSASIELGMKPTTIRKRMLKLKKVGNCDINSDTHFSVVTICNWDKYQATEFTKGQPKGQASDRQVTGKGQASDTNKNEKNEKNEKNKSTLPEFLPESVWKRFLKHRRNVKAPIEGGSYSHFIKKFEKWKAEGWEPEDVINLMVEKGWRSFKPEWVKEDKESDWARRLWKSD